MRIRIALATAMAVAVIPTLIVTTFSSTPAASSARVTRHEAVAVQGSPQVAEHLSFDLMSYAQAEKVSQLVAYAQAVELAKEEETLRVINYLRQLAYIKAVAQAEQQQAAAQAAARVAAAPRTQASYAAPAPASTGGGSDATSTNTADWACIRQHESGGNYSEGGGGAYQFENGTWTSVTGLPGPAQAYPPATQDAAALKLYAERGFEPWTTRYVCGL